MSRAITFSGLQLPHTPDDSPARVLTFYSGPSWLHQAVGDALHRAPEPTADLLYSMGRRGTDWSVLVGSLGSATFEALIRANQADREVTIRTRASADGLTQLRYRVDDDQNAHLTAFANRVVSPTQLHIDEEPFGPVSLQDRVTGSLLGVPDFRTVVVLEFERGMVYDGLDLASPARLHQEIQHRMDTRWRQAVDAVIGLNGIARFIGEASPGSLSVNVIGDELMPF